MLFKKNLIKKQLKIKMYVQIIITKFRHTDNKIRTSLVSTLISC